MDIKGFLLLFFFALCDKCAGEVGAEGGGRI